MYWNRQDCQNGSLDGSEAMDDMREKYIVYTAGEMGVTIKRYSEELGLSVAGFYDNDESLQGGFTDGVRVFTRDEVRDIVGQDGGTGFIIGSETYLNESLHEIKKLYGNEIEVIEPDEIQKRYWVEIALPQREQLGNQYGVDYDTQVALWADSIMSEVAYWIKSNAAVNGEYHDGYITRYNRHGSEFGCTHLHKTLHAGDTILDVGCGICSPYGNGIGDGKLNLTGVDPLAYFYNAINCRVMKSSEERVRFGLFEFLSAFYERDSVDAILADNALDHCIDPFKSILECLTVVRTGGVLAMKHRRCEAVYEGYMGPHQWNMDVSDAGEFIIWNKQNLINISKAVENFADVRICLKKTDKRKDEFIEVEIEKEKTFDIGIFYDREEEHKRMGRVIQAIMMKLSDQRINMQFQKLLEIL